MEKQASSKSVILNYGLIYGILAILLSVAMYAANMHLSPQGGIISIAGIALIIIIIPILGISSYKKANMNLLSWGQAVKIGIGIVILGTLLSIIYNHIFVGFIEPDFYQQIGEMQRNALLESSDLSVEQIDKQLEMQAKFQGTILADAIGILFFAFIGFVVSAIAGAVMKRDAEDGY